jgi:signal transduction histidine kinase
MDAISVAVQVNPPFPAALMWGMRRAAIAAVLGVGVWWISGRLPWSHERRLRFFALHSMFGVAYAALWYGIHYGVLALVASWHEATKVLAPQRLLAWHLLMGLLYYAIVAGISYAIRVARRLRERDIAAARAEALAAHAQLAALRAQLNPHFLFNSLHSLTTLVRHDPATAEQMLDRLGDLLRYALDDSHAEDVSLADEWEFTRNYLALEGLRLGARLRVETSFDDEALEVRVPSFVLQPLVENAIRHGIAVRPEGGTVVISAECADDWLVLGVSDDGPGAQPVVPQTASGLGLRALRRRLDARYHGRGRLDVRTALGAGFRVTVRLPLEVGTPVPAAG